MASTITILLNYNNESETCIIVKNSRSTDKTGRRIDELLVDNAGKTAESDYLEPIAHRASKKIVVGFFYRRTSHILLVYNLLE